MLTAQTRRVGMAATEISNVFTKGEDMSRQLAYACRGPAAPANPSSHLAPQDASYYAELSRPSPAADAPPLQVREYATPRPSQNATPRESTCEAGSTSSQRSGYATLHHSAYSQRSGYATPQHSTGQFSQDNHDEAMAAWQRAVESHHHELHSCLSQLDSAIRSEDYERASRLKFQRDNLKAKPFPPKPLHRALHQGFGVDREIGHAPRDPPALEVFSFSNSPLKPGAAQDATFMKGSIFDGSASTVAQGGPRTNSTGLDFLLSVWQHNPKHTPMPHNIHA